MFLVFLVLFSLEAGALKLRQKETPNLFHPRAQSYAEFSETVRHTFGSAFANVEAQNVTNKATHVLARAGGDPPPPPPVAFPAWIFINHKFGLCYEGAMNDNGLQNVGWCVGTLSCTSSVAGKDEVEFYPSPPGQSCAGRGYTHLSFRDDYYPGNTWVHFGWKFVDEAKILMKDTPMEEEINQWISPPPTAETNRNMDYLGKCMELVKSDEYSYSHPECLPPNAPPSASAAAAEGSLPRKKWYNSMPDSGSVYKAEMPQMPV